MLATPFTLGEWTCCLHFQRIVLMPIALRPSLLFFKKRVHILLQHVSAPQHASYSERNTAFHHVKHPPITRTTL